MIWFYNLKIAQKFVVCFSFMIAFVIGLSAYSLLQLKESNDELSVFRNRSLATVEHVSVLQSSVYQLRNAQLGVLNTDTNAKNLIQFRTTSGQQKDLLKQRMQALEQQSVAFSEHERKDTLELKQQISHFIQLSTMFETQLSPDNASLSYKENINTLSNDLYRTSQKIVDLLTAINAAEEQYIDSAIKQSQRQFTTNIVSSTVIVCCMVLGAVFMCYLLSSLIAKPLQKTVELTTAMANGDYALDIPKAYNDEVGNVLSSLTTMKYNIQEVLTAQADMEQRHKSGSTTYRIDDTPFQGEYQKLVQASNSLVHGHINIKMNIVRVLNEYVNGNFEPRMPQFPGEQAVITQALEGARSKLIDISQSIQHLVNAANIGDFTVRGDASKYNNEFKTMINNLNVLMETSDHNLHDISSVLQAVSQGDLTRRMTGQYKGVFSDVQQHLNHTVDTLVKIVSTIQQSASAINTAATEISMANTELSQRTEQQAAHLEETAASMEELTSTVRLNSMNAQEANSNAQDASHTAQQGAQSMDRVVQAMTDIEQSSRHMRDIVSLIDQIAFQTNILSLNAAVEAARAGDSGRGFAVVAGEIRTLSQKSAASAKDIRGLIDNTTALIGQGSKQAQRSKEIIETVLSTAKTAGEKMEHIAVASQEQSAGIGQINQTVIALDETTQQNAAMVEEAAAAARALEDQAQELLKSIAVFKM